MLRYFSVRDWLMYLGVIKHSWIEDGLVLVGCCSRVGLLLPLFFNGVVVVVFAMSFIDRASVAALGQRACLYNGPCPGSGEAYGTGAFKGSRGKKAALSYNCLHDLYLYLLSLYL
ncbi:hypothetical protein CEXT_163701 [Caerostris extrusa]|uniref:Uncharacterized protein n=1 Tax=Caerostris extrusa TaxID=172846 RepID=A0AAV4XQE7_CAEEX|nr:hypothetical protein CEXT_163701 [Caerostris extrusa]